MEAMQKKEEGRITLETGTCKGPGAGTPTPHTSLQLALVSSEGLREPRPAPGLPQSLINIFFPHSHLGRERMALRKVIPKKL